MPNPASVSRPPSGCCAACSRRWRNPYATWAALAKTGDGPHNDLGLRRFDGRQLPADWANRLFEHGLRDLGFRLPNEEEGDQTTSL
jgi:hypothetical protein